MTKNLLSIITLLFLSGIFGLEAYSQSEPSGTIKGHDYVDLGLPSGVKWATTNVGAKKIKDTGNFFAWGEKISKSEFTVSNSLTSGKKMEDLTGRPRYDAARSQWKETWRIPTSEEWKEMIENCNYKWTNVDGVNGGLFTSKINGNSIFLPAVGWREKNSSYTLGQGGAYWSSTPHWDEESACVVSFGANSLTLESINRYWGLPIRPVTD